MAGGLRPEQEGGAPKSPAVQRRSAADCPAGWLSCKKGDGERRAKTLWLGLRDIALFVWGTRCASGQLWVVSRGVLNPLQLGAGAGNHSEFGVAQVSCHFNFENPSLCFFKLGTRFLPYI